MASSLSDSNCESNAERGLNRFLRDVAPVADTVAHGDGRSGESQQFVCANSSPVRDASPCVVLVPVQSAIEPACEAALVALERRGYAVRRVRGYAAIDQGRNQMATDALRDGFEETMWIDSDIVFDPNDIDRLRAHRLPVVSAIYPQKGRRRLASRVLPGTPELIFGERGRVVEIQYAATGFLLVRKEVYTTLQERLHLPTCNERFERPMIPFFQPMTVSDGDGHWYLAEDWAFCERARQCGFKVYADTRIRLGHVGTYSYTWEDAGTSKRRFPSFRLRLGSEEAPNGEPHAPSQPIQGLSLIHI